MRLADFIESHQEPILSRWDEFARTLVPDSRQLDAPTLRDHGAEILAAIVQDLRTVQSRDQQERKSLGHGPDAGFETAAQTHAVMRASNGFTVRHLVAEYRALRATVSRLWLDDEPLDAHGIDDLGRFNEAIDQAVAESVDYYTTIVERWRNIFLGVLGHDLRTPLNSILMTAELISRESPAPRLGAHIERLLRGGERMAELLDDLLDYKRVALGGRLSILRQPADLVQVCEEELQVLQAAHPHTELRLSVAGPCTGMWDASRIRQALGNLVDNAVKYGHGGEVTVSLACADGRVELSVSNEGPEIGPDEVDAIFDPLRRGRLVQGDARGAHLGLGLFMVRQAVEAHGGKVAVRSADGRTTFTATLPSGGEDRTG